MSKTSKTTRSSPESNFLRDRLIDCDGHCGREGAEINRLAAKTGLSVHMLQSAAYGRKKLSLASERRLRDEIEGRRGRRR